MSLDIRDGFSWGAEEKWNTRIKKEMNDWLALYRRQNLSVGRPFCCSALTDCEIEDSGRCLQPGGLMKVFGGFSLEEPMITMR